MKLLNAGNQGYLQKVNCNFFVPFTLAEMAKKLSLGSIGAILKGHVNLSY